MDTKNAKILNEVHKGLVMGMESISVIQSKVGDRNFRDDLNMQYNEYGKVLDKINNRLTVSDVEIADTNVR